MQQRVSALGAGHGHDTRGDGEADSVFSRAEISHLQAISPRPERRGPVQHVAQARVGWLGFPSSSFLCQCTELCTAGAVLGPSDGRVSQGDSDVVHLTHWGTTGDKTDRQTDRHTNRLCHRVTDRMMWGILSLPAVKSPPGATEALLHSWPTGQACLV
jgi:hypothetical protein